MLFSSMTFLWLFLPGVFIIHCILPPKARNVFLLLASLLFYSWGEPVYIFLMLASILINYLLALFIDKYKDKQAAARWMLIADICINIGLLWYFKYFTTFISGINKVNSLLGGHIGTIEVKDIALPLGISFYTFQILSYVIDVYRGECEVQRNVIDFALYVSFFPQLVAGPIVKYRDVAAQIRERKPNSTQMAAGIRRFIYGLSKKVILANTVASVADSIYAASRDAVASKWLWVGALLYTLQIYYDFSGYSDMAIGLGKMFGFDFPENFDYPYVSVSIREFWRRWHISLSSWFKEYVYIPLGGNRKGKSRTYINLAIVFVITGIWHGATLNFLLWGCFHGFFLLLERGWFGRWLDKNRFKAINHIYTMIVVVVGWAIFRCDSLKEALKLVYHMVVWRNNEMYLWYDFFSVRSIFIIIVAVLMTGFIQERFPSIKRFMLNNERVSIAEGIWQAVLLAVCVILLIGGQYNPFIYFRF